MPKALELREAPDTMLAVPTTSAVKPTIAALVFFLAFHAWLALGYRPATSDARLYALYAFVTTDPRSGTESPYDHFERLKRRNVAMRGGTPLRPDQVTLEYPPLALELIRAPLPFVSKDADGIRGLGEHDTSDWMRGFRLFYLLAHASVMAGVMWWLRRGRFSCPWGLAFGTVAGIVLAYVLYDRLDLWLGLLLLIALSALVTGYRYLALALLAVAVNLKLVPILLAPMFMLGALPASVSVEGFVNRRVLRSLALSCAGFVAACLALYLPFRLLWGPRVWDSLAYHGQRGFQVESTWSSLLLVAAQFGYPAEMIYQFGSDGVEGPGTAALAKVSSLVTLAAVALAYGFLWRALRRRPTATDVDSAPTGTLAEQNPQLFVWGSFAVLAVAVASSKVFSPQYLCWFLPVFVLTKRPRDGRAAAPFLVFLLACGLTTLVFPNLWSEVARHATVDDKSIALLPTVRVTLAMLARNLAWIGFCALAIAQMRTTWLPLTAATIPKPPRARKRHGRR